MMIMKQGTHYVSLMLGLLVALATVVTLGKIAYYTHCWTSVSCFAVVYAVATGLAFRTIRMEYLQLGPNSEEIPIKTFNSKARFFSSFNLILLMLSVFALGWVHH